MLGLVRKVRLGKAFLKLIKDPTQTENVFRIANTLLSSDDQTRLQPILDHVMSNPEFVRLYNQKYLAPKINLDALLKLSEESLGHQFAKHMIANRLDPEFFPTIDVKDPIRYTVMRGRQTHDIFHVLLGYDTSVQDELALQAFVMAQIRSPLSAILLAGGLLHMSILHPQQLLQTADAITRGYERGKKAKFLLSIPWEDRWHEPIKSLRAEAQVG